ncbi:MAG: phosphonate ABC transporter, permease protein PhnE [Pseudomonadota bacterium]
MTAKPEALPGLTARKLAPADVDRIKAAHPDAFERPFHKRFAPVLALGVVVLYTVYSFWFFSIATVFSQGNWGIAGTYLADWVSYEIRPDIDYRTGEIVVEFPRFSPLGSNPQPAWIATQEGQVTLRTQEMAKAPQAAPSAGNSFMSPSSPATSTGSGSGSDNLTNSFMAPSSPATNMGVAPADEGVAEPSLREEIKTGIASATVSFGGGTRIEATPDIVTVFHAGEQLRVSVDAIQRDVQPLLNEGQTMPAWAEQKRPGEKVFLKFGGAGRAEIRDREVKVWRRFFGWENFFFDANSPFWPMTAGERMASIFTGPQIVEGESNAMAMVRDFLGNAEWQHADVWIKLLQTIVMAFVGTLFAVIVAFPLSFFAARNITKSRIVNQIIKRFFDFLRSVDMLIWALFFTRAFGPGPIAGISAIFFTDTGTFGKLYSEALENIDDKQREGVKSVGASPMVVQRFGVVPQVLPVFASQALYFWESNTRSATIIGAVGAGGIGLKLWEAMRTNQDWENVAYMVILILLVVFLFDNISNALRMRLIGNQQTAR